MGTYCGLENRRRQFKRFTTANMKRILPVRE